MNQVVVEGTSKQNANVKVVSIWNQPERNHAGTGKWKRMCKVGTFQQQAEKSARGGGSAVVESTWRASLSRWKRTTAGTVVKGRSGR